MLGGMQKRLGTAQPSSVAGRGGSWRRRTRRCSPRDVWRADFQSAVLVERICWAECKSGWAQPNPPVSRGVVDFGGRRAPALSQYIHLSGRTQSDRGASAPPIFKITKRAGGAARGGRGGGLVTPNVSVNPIWAGAAN